MSISEHAIVFAFNISHGDKSIVDWLDELIDYFWCVVLFRIEGDFVKDVKDIDKFDQIRHIPWIMPRLWMARKRVVWMDSIKNLMSPNRHRTHYKLVTVLLEGVCDCLNTCVYVVNTIRVIGLNISKGTEWLCYQSFCANWLFSWDYSRDKLQAPLYFPLSMISFPPLPFSPPLYWNPVPPSYCNLGYHTEIRYFITARFSNMGQSICNDGKFSDVGPPWQLPREHFR